MVIQAHEWRWSLARTSKKKSTWPKHIGSLEICIFGDEALWKVKHQIFFWIYQRLISIYSGLVVPKLGSENTSVLKTLLSKDITSYHKIETFNSYSSLYIEPKVINISPKRKMILPFNFPQVSRTHKFVIKIFSFMHKFWIEGPGQSLSRYRGATY